MMNDSQPTVILGGGFTGLFTALHLSQQNYRDPVILVDRAERFVFKPLLYDYLTEEMNDSQVNPRYEELLSGSKIQFIRDTVEKIDVDGKQVELANNGSIAYRYLVIALGSQTGHFGIKGAKEHTLPFWNRKDAIALKTHLQDCLKRSLKTDNPQEKQKLLTVAIVGAGATGVELAATLADVLPQWYVKQGGAFEQLRLILINRGEQILDSASNRLRQAAKAAFFKLPVKVQLELNASVTAVRHQQVEFERDDRKETLEAGTIVWTTGTTVNPVVKALPIADKYRDKKSRLKVLSTLQLIDRPEIFVGGDCAVNWDKSVPATAQAAYQQGSAIANNLQALATDKTPDRANVTMQGTMLKLGLNDAAADLFNRLLIEGKTAHLLRQGRYLTTLPTLARDFKVATQWLSEEVLENI